MPVHPGFFTGQCSCRINGRATGGGGEAFLGAGLLAYVVIPGLLVIWDRVLDHMEDRVQK